MTETRQFRGISLRLAVQYLETLGGERVGTEGPADPTGADVDPDPVRVEGDDWTAELSAETVEPVGSFTLTEVTIDFAGDPEAVEPLVEAFSRKAMRAGG